MSTLRRHQFDAGRVVANAKMIFSSSQRHTLVVEGESDYRLLKNWLDDRNARLENVNGKDNVKAVWEKTKERGFKPLHCLADLDYDLIANTRPILDPQFVYVSMDDGQPSEEVECNDLESALIRSSALSKVMAQKYRGQELYGEKFQDRIDRLRESLRVASRNVGAFRAADMRYVKRYGRSPIGGDFPICDVFFDQTLVTVDVEALSDSLLRSSRLSRSAMEEVVDNALALLATFDRGWQLCRGHDLTTMLALHLTAVGARNTTWREVEEDLRMACELDMLKKTRFGQRLMQIGTSAGRPFLTANL
jgi:hypothetical protein